MADPHRAATPRKLTYIITIAIFIFPPILLQDQADAEKLRRSAESDAVTSLRERANSNTISIISGNVNGTYLTIAYDLAAVLNSGDDLRILPVIGTGGGQNISDVRFLRGIDLGITQANILDIYRHTKQIGPIDDKITYIAKLFNEEMHIVVRSDVTRSISCRAIRSASTSSTAQAYFRPRYLRAVGYQSRGGFPGAGGRPLCAEDGGDYCHDADDGQANPPHRWNQIVGRLPSPAGAIPEGAAGGLSASGVHARQRFDRFLVETKSTSGPKASAEDRDRLFQKFLEWNEGHQLP
jgi:hypothetical protein